MEDGDVLMRCAWDDEVVSLQTAKNEIIRRGTIVVKRPQRSYWLVLTVEPLTVLAMANLDVVRASAVYECG